MKNRRCEKTQRSGVKGTQSSVDGCFLILLHPRSFFVVMALIHTHNLYGAILRINGGGDTSRWRVPLVAEHLRILEFGNSLKQLLLPSHSDSALARTVLNRVIWGTDYLRETSRHRSFELRERVINSSTSGHNLVKAGQARFEAFNRIQTRTKGFAQFEYLANPANRLQRPATLDLFEVTYGSGAVLGLETDETVNVSPDVAVVNQSIGGEIDSMGFDGVDGILRNFQFLVLWPYI
ncbi:hypothetical protein F5880DRAFT_1505039 [Lentinula raphanica]|nr:hypothetical protein F5880DRAFT_1505039 [Lentinula raphanica]